MKHLFAIAACLLLAACDPDPNTKTAKNSSQDGGAPTTYKYNGEVDGCQLYYVNPRFGGNQFHFVKCGSAATTVWRESCGKNCSRDVAVRTEDAK